MQKPILIDLDGVLRIGNKPAEYLEHFLDFILSNKIPACILSNSSISTSSQILQFFEQNSLELSIPIITAIDAAKIYLSKKYKKVAVYTSETVIEEFSDFLDYENPDAVLIGDIGDLWNFNLMQTIFEFALNGAEIVAAHKNKYWEKPGKGIILDAGPFVHAIEYATSKKATLIGKPSPIYFQSALKKIGCDIREPFYMLGDDIDSDIVGSKKMGAQTILIYTGKTKSPAPESYLNEIDFQVFNLNEVVDILKAEYS